MGSWGLVGMWCGGNGGAGGESVRVAVGMEARWEQEEVLVFLGPKQHPTVLGIKLPGPKAK